MALEGSRPGCALRPHTRPPSCSHMMLDSVRSPYVAAPNTPTVPYAAHATPARDAWGQCAELHAALVGTRRRSVPWAPPSPPQAPLTKQDDVHGALRDGAARLARRHLGQERHQHGLHTCDR